MQIDVSGMKIELILKNVKNINLSVKPDGSVSVSAPILMPKNKIIEFISSKADWIKRHQEKFLRTTPIQKYERSYNTGETIYLWGEPYELVVESGQRNNVFVCENAILLLRRQNGTIEQREKQLNEWYREQLKEKVTGIISTWEDKTGLKCSSWQIKNMKTRWGTCNTKTKKIWISLQLAKKPIICLEYVILHELVHTRVGNHGKDFKLIMDKYMPEWRDIRKMLNGGEFE